MRRLPHYYIAIFSIAGLFLGLVTGILNRHINQAIHTKFPKDSPAVTGASLIAQFTIIIGVLTIAATYMPYINVYDLGAGIESFAFMNLYFAANGTLVGEINKFVENRFDNLERYR